jgi:hypothetical protein
MRADVARTGGDNMASKALWVVFVVLFVVAMGGVGFLSIWQLTSVPQTTTQSEEEVILLHQATEESVSKNSTYIDHPSSNSNPNANLVVTPNWNPQDSPGIYNNHPIGVWYDSETQRWAIFNQDQAAMPIGAGFNVSLHPHPS